MGETADTSPTEPAKPDSRAIAEQIMQAGSLDEQLDLLRQVILHVADRHRIEEHKLTYLILLHMPYRRTHNF